MIGETWRADLSEQGRGLPVDRVAAHFYAVYCDSVGGKAWNGDSLPDWAALNADPAKARIIEAWKAVARAALGFNPVD